MWPEVNQSASINIDFSFCMSPSPPGGKRQSSGRSVALSVTLQLKVDFKARDFL
jgi:hypothetical protein